jgi:hypothetical protein
MVPDFKNRVREVILELIDGSHIRERTFFDRMRPPVKIIASVLCAVQMVSTIAGCISAEI